MKGEARAMTGTPTHIIAQTFGLIMAALCKALAARSNTRTRWGTPIEPLPAPLIFAIWTRFQKINNRFQKLVALIRADKLPPERVRTAEEAARRAQRRVERAACDPPPPGAPPRTRLPRKFGWVLSLVPCEGGNLASQMGRLLTQPEIAEMIAATPRMARLLKPLCHMLGIEQATLIPPPAAVAADGTRQAGPRSAGVLPACLAPVRKERAAGGRRRGGGGAVLGSVRSG
jgi:hypothetical protein